MRIRQDTCIKVLGTQVGAEKDEVMAAPSSDGLGRREEATAGSCGHYSTNRPMMGPQFLSKHSLCLRENTSGMDSDLDFVTCITPLPLHKSPCMMVIRMNPVYSVVFILVQAPRLQPSSFSAVWLLESTVPHTEVPGVLPTVSSPSEGVSSSSCTNSE